MDEQAQVELARTAARAGDLLAKLTPELEEDLNWLLDILVNQLWEDVKYAQTWDEMIKYRAAAEWIIGTGMNLRTVVEELRDSVEEAQETLK